MHRCNVILTALALNFTIVGAALGQAPRGPVDSSLYERAEPIHYYNGQSRVERLLVLDELSVKADGEMPINAGSLEAPGRTVSPRTPGRATVSFDVPAADRNALNARAAMVRQANTSVRAVIASEQTIHRPSSEQSREVLTNRLAVKLQNPTMLDQVLARHSLEVVRTIGDAYVLQSGGDDLLGALEAANTLYESGAAVFATPLIERQQHKRLMPNDPMFGQQWHLHNTAQVSGAVAGNDVNIIEQWDTYTGAGVNIAITDSGVQVSHPDLSPNARTDIDIDINGNDDDPTPTSDPHGTSCAGIAAAAGQNSVGVIGAGFDAGIVGIRLIEAPTTDAEEAEAMTHQMAPASASDRVHINSNSWGPFDSGQQLATFGPLTGAALADGVAQGRGGNGIIYVWAAGNGRANNDNVNYDGYASSRYTIAVGATGGDGVVSWYSEPGASMFVNAPSSYTGAGTTTTTTGSGYTSGFGGTSSACPLAAGVIALMLEANPNLTWRDVQHILADTAFQNHPADGGWFTNGGGLLFNHNYGFGRVDAAAAVDRVSDWQNIEPETTVASPVMNVNTVVPDNNATGVTSMISLESVPDGFFVEHVEVVLNATHAFGGDFTITLTSPQGTTSTLATTNGNRSDDYSNWLFTSVAHWGEDPTGAWSLKLADLFFADVGTFVNWKITVYGFTVDSNVVSADANHTGIVNGHHNWPFNDFQAAYDAVDPGGTVQVQSNFTLAGPSTFSKAATLDASSTVQIGTS